MGNGGVLMSNKVKYCEDCKHLDGIICRNIEIKSVVNRNRRAEFMVAWKMRGSEWACGKDAKYFEEKKSLLVCLCCHDFGSIEINPVKNNKNETRIFCSTCDSSFWFDGDTLYAECEYRKMMEKVFHEKDMKEF
jgi:hypothetical protein